MILATILSPFTAILAVSMVIFLLLCFIIYSQALYAINKTDTSVGEWIILSVWTVGSILILLAIVCHAYRLADMSNLLVYLGVLVAAMIVAGIVLAVLDRFVRRINHFVESHKRKGHLTHA